MEYKKVEFCKSLESPCLSLRREKLPSCQVAKKDI